ncbi:MAG: ABC transporter ATP-binding protein [Acidobacteria bacterium]|nr:ABC transporter ATP-binding protein [Acidobacteriota bacterium]
MFDLKFDGVSKKYKIREEDHADASPHKVVRKLQSLWRRSKEFWALKDVSFEVERGESLGIIGPNGAGKSTVLKLLSNITSPTTGEIKINGSLSALIEVGSGFHPELTGRENIYLNGSILGMRRREIAKKLESIVEFAEIKPFLDLPVKRYSSGMYVRLGFSIAAHLDPDILLLDEVLAVGDLAFQAKCLRRIEDLRRSGTTIVFISHDLGAVQRLCKRALLMRQGEIVASGSSFDVVNQYQHTAADFSPPDLHGLLITKAAEITGLQLFDLNGKPTEAYDTGQPLQVRLEYFAHERIEDGVFEVLFFSGSRELISQFTTEVSGDPIDIEPGAGVIEFGCAEIGLLPGIYYVDATIKHRAAPEGSHIDWQYQRALLRIDPGRLVYGKFYMPHQWRHQRESLASHLAAEPAVSNVVS